MRLRGTDSSQIKLGHVEMAVQGAMSVNLRKFDMKNIPQDAVAVFIGRRRTGKSTLVRDLLYHHQDMPLGTVISGTEESNGFFKKMNSDKRNGCY